MSISLSLSALFLYCRRNKYIFTLLSSRLPPLIHSFKFVTRLSYLYHFVTAAPPPAYRQRTLILQQCNAMLLLLRSASASQCGRCLSKSKMQLTTGRERWMEGGREGVVVGVLQVTAASLYYTRNCRTA